MTIKLFVLPNKRGNERLSALTQGIGATCRGLALSTRNMTKRKTVSQTLEEAQRQVTPLSPHHSRVVFLQQVQPPLQCCWFGDKVGCQLQPQLAEIDDQPARVVHKV